ncbi:MAG: TolC family protein [Bacteroides sp.]|nr:TolC family protein [Bacteroides sp.]
MICSVTAELKGQEVEEIEVIDLNNLPLEDYANLSLPPLSLLYENARQTPIYEIERVKEQIERSFLRKERRSPLSFFSVRGSYQYGMFGTDVSYSDVYVPVISSYSTSAQSSYTIGAAVNILIDEIFDYTGRVRRQRLLLRVAKLEREAKFEEIQREIIQLYTTALAQLNVLKLRVESVILSGVQYDIAEKDFANGALDSSSLSMEKERQSQALERFENTKFELTKSLMILEIITRTPILKKN